MKNKLLVTHYLNEAKSKFDRFIPELNLLYAEATALPEDQQNDALEQANIRQGEVIDYVLTWEVFFQNADLKAGNITTHQVEDMYFSLREYYDDLCYAKRTQYSPKLGKNNSVTA